MSNIGAKEFDPLQSQNKVPPELKSDKGIPNGKHFDLTAYRPVVVVVAVGSSSHCSGKRTMVLPHPLSLLPLI